MRKIDYHMHTFFSSDSEANPEEHILQAIKLGLDEICFTDHYDVDYPGTSFEMDIPPYLDYMHQLKQKYQDQITIKVGIEMGLDPSHEKEIRRILNTYSFDFVIGSIHAVGNTEFLMGDFFKGKTKQQAHTDYFRQCIACAKLFDDFNVFGHFDYIERYGIYEDNFVETDLYWPLIDEFLKIIISKNKGLEVNTSGYLLRNEGFPKRPILERYYELGGRIITIGTDSHSSDRVGQHVEDVIKILEDIGFEDVSTFTNRQLDISQK